MSLNERKWSQMSLNKIYGAWMNLNESKWTQKNQNGSK